MAVATDREFGLFIGGESVESASAEVRALTEPATGEPLARAAMAGIANDVRYGLQQSDFGRERALETLETYLETKSVVVSTGARPINPFGL